MKILLSMIIMLFLSSCAQNDSQTDASVAEETVAETSLNEEETNTIPVEAYVVKKDKVEEKLPFTAILKPLHSVDIVSEATGKVIKINKELGSSVSKNEILAIIDDVVAKSNYEQAKAQVLTTKNNLKIAELNLKSDKQLFENSDISQLEYNNSELTVKTAEANHLAALANQNFMQKQFQDTRLVSPIKGVVARKFVELGSMVNPSMTVYRVVDLTVLKLEVGVPQSFISNIEIGGEAEVTITALKNKIYLGFVKYISPQADETTGAFMTEIHVKNTVDKIIKAGMSSKVNLVLKSKDKQLIIPNHALITKNGEKYIYKIVKNIAKLVPVTTGDSYGSNAVIEKGLAEGDTIVVVGMKNLGIETKVWIETINNK
ncbi:MAG: efflux RND transporter periplasmic adaptor subunit [Calditrichia bacterium]|nr:efflux RND transporter periplasmic adaptor subunit [Calditrichia bacterium]